MRLPGGLLLVVGLSACAGKAGSKTDVHVAGHSGDVGGSAAEQDDGGRVNAGSASTGTSGVGGSAGEQDDSSGGRALGGNGGQSVVSTAGGGAEAEQPETGQVLELLLDPGFRGMPVNAWSLLESATIEPSAVTNGVDPGQLRINFCIHEFPGLFASQQFDAPSFAVAGPSSIVAHWRPGKGSSYLLMSLRGRNMSLKSGGASGGAGGVSEGSGGTSASGGTSGGPSFDPTWTTQHACLGEDAYGPGLRLDLGFRRGSTCWPENYAFIDRIDFVSGDSRCPPLGSVLNGDFEQAHGWDDLTDHGPSAEPGTRAEILDGLGPTGTRAAYLAHGRLAGSMSVPLGSSLASPMLRMKVKGTVNTTLAISAGGVRAVVSGTGVFTSLGLCLSDADAGVVSDLLFESTGQGDFVVDDLTLVSDPECANLRVADGGFESLAAISTWLTSSAPTAVMQIESGILAHSGSRYLHASTTDGCSVPSATADISIPPSAAGAGPALRFFYRRPQPQTHVAYLVQSPLYVSTPLPPAEDWTEQIICLPATKPGDPVGSGTIRFTEDFSGTCGAPYPAEELFVDDLTVTTDPSCPTQ